MNAAENKAVFLSYASQDADAVRRICEALRAAGVEVWFDQNELVGGDAWDRKIRQQIRECALFLPIISANTQSRLEGYFRLEWKLAEDRSHLMAKGKPFLLPVCIDQTSDREAHVPDAFLAVQWTRLLGGEPNPEFAMRVRALLESGSGAAAAEGGGVRPRSLVAGEAEKEPRPTPVIAPRRRGRWLFIAGALTVFAIGLIVAWTFRPSGESASDRDPELQRAAALIDFNSPDSSAEGYALAEDILKSVLARRPADVDAVILYAWLNDLFLIRGFDNSEARRGLARQFAERAVKLAPRNADALAAQGLAYGAGPMGDPTRAEKPLRDAIALNPRDPRYYRMLSFTLIAQGRRDEALANARRALELFPRECLVHYDYGLAQLYLGDYEGAEKAFREALTVTPPGSLLHADLHADLAAFAAFARADPPGMRDWLERMPAQHRDQPRAVMPRFIYASASGDTAQALVDLRALSGAWLRNYGELPRALLIGDLLLQAGNAPQARVEFEAAQAEIAQARTREPGNVRYRILELWALWRIGRAEEARAALPPVVAAITDPMFDPLYPGEYWYGPLPLSLVLGDKATALTFLRGAATTPFWRRYYRNMLQIDPRVKAWRGDPEIGAALEMAPVDNTVAVGASEISLAVLPFVNQSDDKAATDFFTEGVYEDILTKLTNLHGVRVVSRPTAEQYRSTNKSARQIGAELGVAWILHGSVRRAGNKVRATGQLIDARADRQVWAQDYNKDLTAGDIFDIQSDLAQRIAASLRAVVSPEEQKEITRRPTQNLAAYESYLEAQDEMVKRRSDDRLVEKYLRTAVERDPSFADAWALLLGMQSYAYGTRERTPERLEQARASYQALMKLAPDAAGTLRATARYYLWCLGDFDRATEQAERLIRLQPNDWAGYFTLEVIQFRQGKLREAIANLRQVIAFEPTSWYARLQLIGPLAGCRRYAEVIREYERILELNPDLSSDRLQLALWHFRARGSTREADAFFAALPQEQANAPEMIVQQRDWAAMRGDLDKFLRLDALLPEPRGNARFSRALARAVVLAAKGDMAGVRQLLGPLESTAQESAAKNPGSHASWRAAAELAAMLNHAEVAQACIQKLEVLPAEQLNAPRTAADNLRTRAFVHTMLGDKAAAIADYGRLFGMVFGNLSVSEMRRHPRYAPLRGDPAFEALLNDPKNDQPLF